MKNLLKDKIEEISLMLVMAGESDSQGTNFILDLCVDLGKQAASDSAFERLAKACNYLEKKRQDPNILKLLTEFSKAATLYMEGASDTKFPNEGAQKSDPLDGVDKQFLAEFIETHSLLLDEFEGQLLDSNIGEDPDAIMQSVKGYIHNLKGDAGAVGLKCVEMVCHQIETSLEGRDIFEATTELLLFKEWVTSCLDSYKKGQKEKLSGEQFLEGLNRIRIVEDASDALSGSSELVDAHDSIPEDQRSYDVSGELDIMLEFAAEAEEHLNVVEAVLLESGGNYSKEAIDQIFRAVHSIKGGSAYFNLQEMINCSHILENLLSEVRDGKRILDKPLVALLLKYIDLQKDVLTRAREAVNNNAKMEFSEGSLTFLTDLDAYQKGKASPSSSNEVPKTTKVVEVDAPIETPTQLKTEVSSMTPEQSDTDKKDTGRVEVRTFVKVDTNRLDHLIDSIGEMVIYSSMLVRHCRELLGNNPRIMDISQRVEKFSRDLQDVGMSMRLVPIKSLFQKMSRLVWDTSRRLGKDIEFEMVGEDTELDRTLIDKLADPLMHMVRNALDHGIESPEDRSSKGKNTKGRVKLSAFHAGGSIHIQIKDDGKGLDAEKLMAKAIEKGIISSGQRLTESEAYNLIFAPGFSTAAAVTDLSGRGVGMDVVRRNVESLRGRIHIQSKINEGSTFTIEVPLTLAIVDGIQVNVGQENFVIPSLAVVEFVKPLEEQISNTLDFGETLHFRGRYLPIFRLAELYNIETNVRDLTKGTLIIIQNNSEQVALFVDDIESQYSTVIKSLGPIFGEANGFAGCAIMPNGDVALILDLHSLVTLARRDYRSTREKASLNGGLSENATM